MLLWALLALVAGGLLLVPVARVSLGVDHRTADPGIRGREVLVVVVAASVVASIAAWLLMPLSNRIPLAVGGYVVTWFLVAGAVVAGCWLWRWRASAGWPVITVRSVVGALAATALATVVVVVPGSMSWTPFAVVGARAWLLPVVALAFLAYFAADELLVRRASLPRRLGLALGNRLIAVAVILASIPLLGAPGFLVLLLPLMVVFLMVLAGYAAVVSRYRNGYLAAVLVQAVPLALLVATTFPLVDAGLGGADDPDAVADAEDAAAQDTRVDAAQSQRTALRRGRQAQRIDAEPRRELRAAGMRRRRHLERRLPEVEHGARGEVVDAEVEIDVDLVAGERHALRRRRHQQRGARVHHRHLRLGIGRSGGPAPAAALTPVVADEALLDVDHHLCRDLPLLHCRAHDQQLDRALVARRRSHGRRGRLPARQHPDGERRARRPALGRSRG